MADTSRFIHDGAIGQPELLNRARDYVSRVLFGNFPQAVPAAGASILEIGSGLGWIMQAMREFLRGCGHDPGQILGLDIAPNMIRQAEERLGSDSEMRFVLYDGVTVPLADRSLDLVYSVAALQHIPRPFVFNLFFETMRLLSPAGMAVFHFLSTDALPLQEKQHPWRDEIRNQVQGVTAHWHHFYTAKELRDVLLITGFPYVGVHDDGAGTIVTCVSNSALQLPDDFDPEAYLHLNPDVRRAKVEPRQHWLAVGHEEGRRWRPSAASTPGVQVSARAGIRRLARSLLRAP